MTTYTTTLRRQRQRALALVLITLGALLAFTGPGPFGSPASAQTNTNGGVTINSISDYANYPNDAILPPGCNAFTVLQDLRYQLDPDGSGPAPAGAQFQSLVALGNNLPFGSTVIMTWSGWAPGCASVISLSVKKADFGTFNENTNQELISFVACDAAGNGCTVAPGSYRLELTMPSFLQGGCHYQVDAVVGPPLDVVGPQGSFYSNVYRASRAATMNEAGDDMLIHANNGRGVCEPPQETTTTTVATTTTLATTTTTQATTTTTDPGTTTTTVPGSTTTSSVLGTTLTQPSTTSTTAEVLGVTVTRPGSSNLARTGAGGDGTRTLLAIGLVLAGLGVALFGQDRKLGAMRQQ